MLEILSQDKERSSENVDKQGIMSFGWGQGEVVTC